MILYIMHTKVTTLYNKSLKILSQKYYFTKSKSKFVKEINLDILA